MRTLNIKTAENKEIAEKIKKLLEKEKIEGEFWLSDDEELKGAIHAMVKAKNIKSIDKAINVGIKLDKKIKKLVPNKYILFHVFPS